MIKVFGVWLKPEEVAALVMLAFGGPTALLLIVWFIRGQFRVKP